MNYFVRSKSVHFHYMLGSLWSHWSPISSRRSRGVKGWSVPRGHLPHVRSLVITLLTNLSDRQGICMFPHHGGSHVIKLLTNLFQIISIVWFSVCITHFLLWYFNINSSIYLFIINILHIIVYFTKTHSNIQIFVRVKLNELTHSWSGKRVYKVHNTYL